MKVALVQESSAVSLKDVHKIAEACYVAGRELCRAWERITPTVRVFDKLSQVPADYCLHVLLDDTDQAEALAYHDVTPDGRPYAKTFVGTVLDNGGNSVLEGPLSVASVTSHEHLEMTLDPPASFWHTYNGRGDLIALEACDPVQAFGYQVKLKSGAWVTISDWILPSYVNVFSKVGPWDYMGVLKGPAPKLARGGYAIVDRGTGQGEIFGTVGPRWKRKMKVEFPTSRTFQRLQAVTTRDVELAP